MMKKLLFTFAAICIGFVASAQDAGKSASERSEWLTSFTSVVVNAPADISFVCIPENEAPKIVYDTKGSYTTKFKFEVSDKVLSITEKSDSRRLDRTSITVYYNTLISASLEQAVVSFTQPVKALMFDLTVGADATVTLPMEVQDLKVEVSGRSRLTLTGTAKYLSMFVSTGKVEASGLEVIAAQVNAQSSAEVAMQVTDRLEAKTTTKGKITYKGLPSIVRTSTGFLGGTISDLK